MEVQFIDKDGKKHTIKVGKKLWVSVDMPDKDGEKQCAEYGLEEILSFESGNQQYVTHGELSIFPSNSRGICVEPGSHHDLIIKPTK